MKDFLRQLGAAANTKLKTATVPIPITAHMLLWMFRRQTKEERENIHNVEVIIKDGFIRISGVTKKLLMHIYFEIDIKPIQAEKRTVYFQVLHMKPMNQSWIKSKIFNQPPVSYYDNDVLLLNLNEIKQIKKLGAGVIKQVDIRGDKLWVRVGI